MLYNLFFVKCDLKNNMIWFMSHLNEISLNYFNEYLNPTD